MIDSLPNTFQIPTRAQIVSQYKADYLSRNPGTPGAPTDTSIGSLVDIDANVMADTLAPIYYNASLVGNAAALDNMTTQQIAAELQNLGTAFLPATGASGEVYVSCSAGGTFIAAGQQLTNLATGLRYQCNASALYQNGQPLPVAGIDTGPQSNILATTPPTVLTWTSAPIGCNPSAAIVPQTDGTGLSGGSAAETNAHAVARIRSLRANPPASGNDSQYQALIVDTPDVAVQAAFTYPAIVGPGTTAVCFTLVPSTPGASRIPNGAQILAAQNWLAGQVPANDVPLFATLVASPVTVVLGVTWAPGAPGWADAAPYPLYQYMGAVPVVAVPATGPITPTFFALANATGTVLPPQVGQSIALYNAEAALFVRKRIASVVQDSFGSWAVTVDTTTSTSDQTYAPTVGQRFCPWSDSLNSIVGPVVNYFATLGPGEMKTGPTDAGQRGMRRPPNPQAWPSALTNRMLGVSSQQAVQGAVTLFTLPTLSDVVMQEPTVPYSPPVGIPGVAAYLLTLGDLLVFPEAYI